MNRRTFTTMALLGLAVATALPQAGLAQSNSRIGTWKLNLAKSKYSPGPPPRSNTAIFEAVGQGLRTTAEGIDAQGNPTKAVFGPYFYDGKSYPITGSPAFDAASYKQVNASISESTRTKAGEWSRQQHWYFLRMASHLPSRPRVSTKRGSRSTASPSMISSKLLER